MNESYKGAVRPHPDFKIALTPHGSPESSHADLALILLTKPATHNVPPVRLSDAEATASDSLVTVGYGDDELSTGTYEDRRFGKHRVIKPPEPGTDLIVLAPPVRPEYQDDSGGPCLLEVGEVQVLVGISRRGRGQESACTSTHIYETWLTEEMRRMTQPSPSTTP